MPKLKHTSVYHGADLGTPWWHVYAFALRGKKAERFAIQAATADEARRLTAQLVPLPSADCIVGIYLVDPTPDVASPYGAPLGRASDALDPDAPATHLRAKLVRLDRYGYDNGGAYWGHEIWPPRRRVYAVQDGMGNVRYVRALSGDEALRNAIEANK